ncbi:hypothetical protein PQR64_24035 [Paraburkholderia phytofirmans]|uniref:hypothetical protein n=1 Tax=Paraburkholderia phytofirmans TaxID=261302 RepID=UPI0038BDAFED
MRILIGCKSKIYSFVNVEAVDRDGSLILTIRRKGDSTYRMSGMTGSEKNALVHEDFGRPRPKDKRITIHQSGRVNFKENKSTIYIEPLTQTNTAFRVYQYRIPSIQKLDVFAKTKRDEDVIFEMDEPDDRPISFSFFIGPSQFTAPGRAFKLDSGQQGYALSIAIDTGIMEAPPQCEDHFITGTPLRGIFETQQMPEDEALLAYHRAVTGAKGAILYAPNGEGDFKFIFAVPMRIAPKFVIELVEADLHVTEQDVQREARSEKVMLRFKIREQATGKLVKRPVAIRSIVLDAEL